MVKPKVLSLLFFFFEDNFTFFRRCRRKTYMYKVRQFWAARVETMGRSQVMYAATVRCSKNARVRGDFSSIRRWGQCDQIKLKMSDEKKVHNLPVKTVQIGFLVIYVNDK